MWSYECVFEHSDIAETLASSKSLTQTSISVVAETGELALQFALNELKNNPDYELIGIARRNAIRTILKNK